ncbi:hypothetical protein HDU96_007627 [Phlyctochytrium bullatum]|nr:hypothetical protein HDU96_007627 [Phlyctochytrium bullatum]
MAPPGASSGTSSRRSILVMALLAICFLVILTVISGTNIAASVSPSSNGSSREKAAAEPADRVETPSKGGLKHEGEGDDDWEVIPPAQKVGASKPADPEEKKQAAVAAAAAAVKAAEKVVVPEKVIVDDAKTGGAAEGDKPASPQGSAGKGRVPAEPIMSKMANETLKAELGRSAWRLLHTMAGKFPYKPTDAQKDAMRDYIYLFAQLYPCGDCARHFKLVLEAHPPVVDDRISLSQWACTVHNVVNKRLNKTLFDCATVLDVYKCGCAEEENGTSTFVIPETRPTSKPNQVNLKDLSGVKLLGAKKGTEKINKP